MYSGAVNNMGLGLRMNNISVAGSPGGKTSLVCLGDGRKNSIAGADTLPNSIIDTGSNVNYSNLIQVTGGGTGNGRDAAALGIETDGDYCLSAMGGLSHLQGLALAAEIVTNSSYTADTNKTLFIFSGTAFTMPANPKPGQLVIVIQTSSSQVTYNGNGKRFCKGTTTASTVSYRSAGRMVIFVYDSNQGYWRYAYAS